jgi:hypothetical protein
MKHIPPSRRQLHSPDPVMSTADNNDPFNPEALRLNQNFTETVGVKKLLTVVPVRKPNKHDFVRVNPEQGYRLAGCAIVELKDAGETYLVSPAMAVELPGMYVVANLFTTVTRQGVLFLWPVKLPGPDGRPNVWHSSAAEAAELAMTRWVRVSANMSLGAYDMSVAAGNLPEPTWPDLAFREILKIAFKDRFVESGDHPLVQQLLGTV